MSDPEIPDEAVEAAAEGFWEAAPPNSYRWSWDRLKTSAHPHADEVRQQARAGLAAALPALRQQWEGRISDNPLPEHLRGDGPCSNCGTKDNPIWFTESVFWNAVVRTEPRLTDDAEILCIRCFVIMADQRGYRCHWRLLPEWHWETKAEHDARVAVREFGEGT